MAGMRAPGECPCAVIAPQEVPVDPAADGRDVGTRLMRRAQGQRGIEVEAARGEVRKDVVQVIEARAELLRTAAMDARAERAERHGDAMMPEVGETVPERRTSQEADAGASVGAVDAEPAFHLVAALAHPRAAGEAGDRVPDPDRLGIPRRGVHHARGDLIDGDDIESCLGIALDRAEVSEPDERGERAEAGGAVDPSRERERAARRDDARADDAEAHGAAALDEQVLAEALRERVGVRVPRAREQGGIARAAVDRREQFRRRQRERREHLLNRHVVPGVRGHVRGGDVHEALERRTAAHRLEEIEARPDVGARRLGCGEVEADRGGGVDDVRDRVERRGRGAVEPEPLVDQVAVEHDDPFRPVARQRREAGGPRDLQSEAIGSAGAPLPADEHQHAIHGELLAPAHERLEQDLPEEAGRAGHEPGGGTAAHHWFPAAKRLDGSTARFMAAVHRRAAGERVRSRNPARILPMPW